MKPGPIVAMLLILGLALWIMLWTSPSKPATPNAAQIELVIANRKLQVEQLPSKTIPGEYQFRFRNWDEKGDGWFTQSEFNEIVMKNADVKGRSWILKACNVTSYANLAWVAFGLGGQLVFAGRMIVQWLASEKSRKSVVPPAFWYMSLAGGLCLTAYFVWRHDLVGVLGQAMGLVVYVRNIRLLTLHRQGVQPVPNAVPASS
jgi:lipid-A-disaccharide synthase-like uncharacterized protein